MKSSLRTAGVMMLTPSGYALAQPAPPASSASQPGVPDPVKTPVDPTWLVADVAIALIIGAIVGYLVGARRAKTASASHA
jgi:hypothetical protein